jgi:hypothetical protein
MPKKISSFFLKIEKLVKFILEKNSKFYQNVWWNIWKNLLEKNTLDRNENEVAFECNIYHRCVVTKS